MWHVGWNQTSLLGHARRMKECFFGLSLSLHSGSEKLQHQLYLAFRVLQQPEPVRAALLRRSRLIDPTTSPSTIDTLCLSLHKICTKTSMYLGVAPLRMITGSICTSARFHSRAAGCLFGCSADPGIDLDSIRHYSSCQRLEGMIRRWMGDDICVQNGNVRHHWFSSCLLLHSDSFASCLKRAACIDAFIAALNSRRLDRPASPAQAFEARLRVTARRHKPLASAWSFDFSRPCRAAAMQTLRPEAMPARAPCTPRGRWVLPIAGTQMADGMPDGPLRHRSGSSHRTAQAKARPS